MAFIIKAFPLFQIHKPNHHKGWSSEAYKAPAAQTPKTFFVILLVAFGIRASKPHGQLALKKSPPVRAGNLV
jgi:hypothetical protein